MESLPSTEATMSDTKPKKTAPSHPPYAQMIAEAISELKERSGSSVPAITKKIGEPRLLGASPLV